MSTPVNVDLDFNNQARILNLPDPTAAQHPATRAYVDSAIEGVNWKDSVRVSTQGNINLASPGATIDGITMSVGDRFIARSQTAGEENGIYIWNGAATPATRSLDMNSAAEVEQAVTTVEEGTNAGVTYRQTQVNVTLDTTALAWTLFGSAAGSASTTSAGVVELLTQSELDTGTDNQRAPTADILAAWVGRKFKYTATFGDGSTTLFTHTHNFNTKDVQVYVYEAGGDQREVICEKRNNNVNSVQTQFASAPATNSLRIVVIG